MVWLALFAVWCLQLLEALLTKMDVVVDDLAQKWKIEDTEDLEVIRLEDIEELTSNQFWPVGKLLTSKPYSAVSLSNKMGNIWKTRDKVTILEWKGSDRLLFAFGSDTDRKRVLRGGPWKFDNAMLILACSDGDTNPRSVQLESQNFWIRVRGLPPKLFNKAMGRRIGNMLAVYVDFDGDARS